MIDFYDKQKKQKTFEILNVIWMLESTDTENNIPDTFEH